MTRHPRTLSRPLYFAAAISVATLAIGSALAPAAGALSRDSDPTLDQVLSGRHVLRSTAEVESLAADTAGDDGVRLMVLSDAPTGDARRITAVTAPADRVDDVTDRLESVAGVVAVGPDAPVRSTADPTDPGFTHQYSYRRTRADRLPSTATGDGTIVAVIDSGVDGNHPDLDDLLPGGRPRVLPGITYLYGDPREGSPGNRDLGQHGTHVAAIIAAARDNGVGIAGAAPDAQILPVRVLDQNGAGSLIDVLDGMLYAFEEGADVINLSLAGAITDPEAISVISEVVRIVTTDTSRGKPGAVVVAAAGNSGAGSWTMFPAADSRVIAVASTDASDRVTASSSRGPWVDVAAPGNAILSACGGTSGYCYMSGTSMASPLVAAAAAVLRQQNPNRTDVQAVLERSAYDVDALGRDRSSGAGRLDIASAFDPTTSPKVVRPLAMVTGRQENVRASGRSIVVEGAAYDPEGTVTMVVESNGPNGWQRRTNYSSNGRYWMQWQASPGEHLVCTSVLDNPTGRSLALGCANVVIK